MGNYNRHKTSSKCAAALLSAAAAGLTVGDVPLCGANGDAAQLQSKSHECRYCHKAYNRKDNLDKHLREKHGAGGVVVLLT